MSELIDLKWGIFDIQYVRQDLTDEQAMSVLVYLKASHDYKNGVTDATIRTAAHELFPKSKP
jgi:hypothetical protein